MASILVVDDEMGIRELLNEILTDEGHTVYAAESAVQARTIREQMRPDLVLLDIWMPDVDGITLLKEWSKSGQLTMPVVMMSGHATIDTAVEATRIGALNFLEKPIALQNYSRLSIRRLRVRLSILSPLKKGYPQRLYQPQALRRWSVSRRHKFKMVSTSAGLQKPILIYRCVRLGTCSKKPTLSIK